MSLKNTNKPCIYLAASSYLKRSNKRKKNMKTKQKCVLKCIEMNLDIRPKLLLFQTLKFPSSNLFISMKYNIYIHTFIHRNL